MLTGIAGSEGLGHPLRTISGRFCCLSSSVILLTSWHETMGLPSALLGSQWPDTNTMAGKDQRHLGGSPWFVFLGLLCQHLSDPNTYLLPLWSFLLCVFFCACVHLLLPWGDSRILGPCLGMFRRDLTDAFSLFQNLSSFLFFFYLHFNFVRHGHTPKPIV